MPAQVQVTNGPDTGLLAPIRGAFLRIGSDPGCDLVLSGEAPHALVVRTRGEQRYLYNRSPDPVRVGRKSIPSESSAPWRAGQPLRLASGAELRWAESAEPKLSIDAAPRSAVGLDAEDPNEATLAEPSGNSRLRTVALSLAITGLALFVFDGDASLAGSATRMHRIVENLEYREDRRLQLIRCAIQEGRLAELRDNQADAYTHYAQARELLRGASDAAGSRGQSADLEREARDFVNDGLTRCESGPRQPAWRRKKKA